MKSLLWYAGIQFTAIYVERQFKSQGMVFVCHVFLLGVNDRWDEWDGWMDAADRDVTNPDGRVVIAVSSVCQPASA